MKKLITTLICFVLLYSADAQLCSPNTNSIRFNGHSSYVSFPSNPDLNITDNITVEAWIKANSFNPSPVQGSVVCKHGWTNGERGYVLRAGGNGILSFCIAGLNPHGTNDSWIEVQSAANALQLNTWYHVAGTFDGHKLRLYINGSLVNTESYHGSIDPSIDYDLKIGRIADDYTNDKRFWDGWIDEVRIWNSVRSEADLSSHMDEHISAQNNLVGYWRFNNGSGLTTDDRGSSNNTGTLHSVTWNTDVPFTNGITRPTITYSGTDLTSSALFGNQWNLNGVPIPGATGNSFTPQTGGDYSVTSNGLLGCSATSDIYSISITGVNELSNTSFQIVQTNSGSIHFISTEKISSTVDINIFDLNGNSVIANQNQNLNEDVDVSNLSSGVYFVRLNDREKMFTNLFFKKQTN